MSTKQPENELLQPLISGKEISSELRGRRSKRIFQTINASNTHRLSQKVKLEEDDGWEIHRKNVKSTRMSKPKEADQQLEDDVWSILAQMGFDEMNSGRQFKIAVGDGINPRQIDVFAKDNESAIIVECTQTNKPSKQSMANLIQKIGDIRNEIRSSVCKYYKNNKLKVKFVIVTRNISWSENDLERCKNKQIAVITEKELEYYSELVKHLKYAAKYQLLGHLFEGQKIQGLNYQVLATRGKMGGNNFYYFLMPPDHLLKIAYVGHKASRDIDDLETYQRMLSAPRLRKIAKFINEGGKFPTNIVLNLKTKKNLKFDNKNSENGSFGILHLPSVYGSAWIIDGQHRLYGYAYSDNREGFNQDTTVLPVLAYENLPAEKEMDLFIDINSKQVKVNTGLLTELYADLHWKSPNQEEAFQALLSRIASRLNSESISPLKDRVAVVGKKKTQNRCLTQTSIRTGLKVANLLGKCTKNINLPGPLSTGKTDAYERNLNKSLSVLSDCLGMFEEALPEHWEAGDGFGGYLCTNNGIRALFLVLEDISNHIESEEGIDLYLKNPEETFQEIKPYLKVLVDYFKSASENEIKQLRGIGSSLVIVRNQAHRMNFQIQKTYQDYTPQGLQKFIDSMDEEGTERARNKVSQIEMSLFKYVINELKHNFRDDWWVESIPQNIRVSCSQRWEEKNRAGDIESQLFLLDYVAICKQNWSHVKEVISLDKSDKEAKTANTKWISDLNKIRNQVFHPTRGPLNTSQVEKVEEIYNLVEKFFPQES